MNAIFSRIGKPFIIGVLPSGRGMPMLDNGQADAPFTVKKTPEREAAYAFSQSSVLVRDMVVFVPADSRLECKGDLDALADRSIGILRDSSLVPEFDTERRKGTVKEIDVALTSELNFKNSWSAAWMWYLPAGPLGQPW